MTEFQAQTRVTTHFDDAANVYGSWYDLPNSEGHSFRIRRTRVMESLAKHLPKDSTVADIGCGPGTMVKDLLDAGYRVVATVIAPHMIEQCRNLFAGDSRARFEVCPADAMPLDAGSVQAVSAMGLMEYLNDEDATLREFHRVLAPNGIALLTYPHRASSTRAWNRLTHALVKPILAMVRKGKPVSGVKHREYGLRETISQVEKIGFKVEDIIFYNFKLGFRPLDTMFPWLTMKVSEALECFCRTPVLRRIGTGFIVLARKK